MAKEKKGTKKVAAKATKKPAARKVAAKKVERNTKKCNNWLPIVYMFLLILGVSLIFVSLALFMTNYIDTRLMVICLGISLVSIIASIFVKRFGE